MVLLDLLDPGTSHRSLLDGLSERVKDSGERHGCVDGEQIGGSVMCIKVKIGKLGSVYKITN